MKAINSVRPDSTAGLPPDPGLDRYLRERGLGSRRLPAETLEELSLCAGCAAGRAAAWEEFWLRYRPFLLLVAGQLTRNQTAAEDLAAEVVEKLMTEGKLNSYQGRGSLRGWLRAVLVHHFLDGLRKASRARLESLEELAPGQHPAAGDEGVEDCARHYRLELLRDLAGHLAGALHNLPRRKAAFLNLYYYQGLTLAEAAANLGIHESSASRWNGKILQRLRQEVVAFLERQRGWSRGETADFMERCLEWLGKRLHDLQHRFTTGEIPCKFLPGGRPDDDET